SCEGCWPDCAERSRVACLLQWYMTAARSPKPPFTSRVHLVDERAEKVLCRRSHHSCPREPRPDCRLPISQGRRRRAVNKKLLSLSGSSGIPSARTCWSARCTD
ncbi:MAG TPA: hypothetical protein VMK12_21445, partial [Anaeromyxobacteraceae bacterium]|nr:hypothetical protein [Anaeromyxobacteraceae bacterium]